MQEDQEQVRKWRGWVEQIESLELQAETADDEIKAERLQGVAQKLKEKLFLEAPAPSKTISEIMQDDGFAATLYYYIHHVNDMKVAIYIMAYYSQALTS